MSPDHINSQTDKPKVITSKALDVRHILRVVYKTEDGIITVITIYPAEKGKYYEMRFKYNKEDDILVIDLNDQPVDYAEQTGDLIVHFSNKRRAVSLEILDASQFFKKAAKTLPNQIKQEIFSQPFSVAHQIKK